MSKSGAVAAYVRLCAALFLCCRQKLFLQKLYILQANILSDMRKTDRLQYRKGWKKDEEDKSYITGNHVRIMSYRLRERGSGE